LARRARQVQRTLAGGSTGLHARDGSTDADGIPPDEAAATDDRSAAHDRFAVSDRGDSSSPIHLNDPRIARFELDRHRQRYLRASDFVE